MLQFSSDVREQCQRAKAASKAMALMSSGQRNSVLHAMAFALEENIEVLLAANRQDLELAYDQGISPGLIDRLTLNRERIQQMVGALKTIAAQQDPLGRVDEGWTLENGLTIEKRRVPLGVIALIYEARPNVTLDALALAIKSGNAVVLRGGSLAYHSCYTLASFLAEAAYAAGVPDGALQYVSSREREASYEIMRAVGLVDVLIPRGSASLIRECVLHARVPLIETGTGNCHVYLHATADPKLAEQIVLNAKTQRVSVCNAAESLLIDRNLSQACVLKVLGALADAGVELYVDERVFELVSQEGIACMRATKEDFAQEYLAMRMSVAMVNDLDGALEHIARYSSGHSEAIIANDYTAVERFLREVDSAAVYVNASTRFTDGSVYGLGAEIGISTQKLHARGPMGASALTTTKYVVRGEGQIRE